MTTSKVIICISKSQRHPRHLHSNVTSLTNNLRSYEVPHTHRPQEGLDARHFLQEREDWSLPQHPRQQRLHQGLPQRRCPLQYPDLSDSLLPHEPQAVSHGQADVRPQDRQLWLHHGRHHVQVGHRGPCPAGQEPQPAEVQHREVLQQLLQRQDQHGGVQLPVSGPRVQAAVLLLPHHHLRAGLHAGHRVLGQLLAGPQGCAGQGGAGGDDAADDVHPDRLHQLRPAPRGLHQGHRRVAGSLCRLRLLRPDGVCPGQLRTQGGGQEEEEDELSGGGGSSRQTGDLRLAVCQLS